MNSIGQLVVTIEASLLTLAVFAVGLWLAVSPEVLDDERTDVATLGVMTAGQVEVGPDGKTGDRVRVMWHGDASRIGARWFGAAGASGETLPIVSEVVRDSRERAKSPWAPLAEVAVFQFADGVGSIAALGPAADVGTVRPAAPAIRVEHLTAWLLMGFALVAGAWPARRWFRHADARRRVRIIPWQSRWMGGQD